MKGGILKGLPFFYLELKKTNRSDITKQLLFFCHFDQREKSHLLLSLCDFSFVEMTNSVQT